MANEAMSEERLQEVQSFYEDMPDSFMSKAYLGMMISALREAQKRAEKAEEAGYRRGVQAAIETAKQQRCRDEYPKTNREKISHERGCNGAIKRIRALLPPDTQTEEATK